MLNVVIQIKSGDTDECWHTSEKQAGSRVNGVMGTVQVSWNCTWWVPAGGTHPRTQRLHSLLWHSSAGSENSVHTKPARECSQQLYL